MERLIRQLDSFMGQARWDEAEALLCRCRVLLRTLREEDAPCR